MIIGTYSHTSDIITEFGEDYNILVQIGLNRRKTLSLNRESMDIIVRKWIDRKPQRLFSHTNWTYASFYTFSFSFLYNNLYRQVNVLLWRHQWRKFRRERMNVYITSRDIRWTSVTSHQAHAHPPTIVVFFVDPQQPPGGNQEKKKRLSCQCCKSLYTSDSTSAYGQQSKWVNHMQIPATHKQPDNTHTHKSPAQ